jgi:hypothetical protein
VNRLRLALFARRVLDAYLEIYHDTEDSGPDSGMSAYDTASTVSGQYELSAGGNGSTFGFGPPRRALRLRDIDVGEHDE